MGRPWRRYTAMALGSVMVAVLAGFWYMSRLPASYSVMSMGVVDTGGFPDHEHSAATVSVTDLVADPLRPADVSVDLVAGKGPLTLPDGRVIDGYSINGISPGPTIEATQGQLVQVRVRNENVPDGVTLHWHGVDVPNAMDGVPGVTQDAIGVGEVFVYRFVADQVGTYWYHSHQMAHEQSVRGMFGALVVHPKGERAAPDAVALLHTYDGVRTINGTARDSQVPASPGQVLRVRVINTDNGPMPVWAPGAPFRVLAVDGHDVNRPELVSDRTVLITAGGRADLEVTVPADGAVRIQCAGASLILGDGPAPSGPAPTDQVDMLHYGQPAPIGFDPQSADRNYRYDIGRRPGLLDGRPGVWWTVNGRMYPDVPMFMIHEGEVGRFTITNSSGEVHPMHLHGHHMVVVSRDGVAATGSPWWVDSLNVEDGQTYEVAFLADNPGIWVDHCHNLPHVNQGLVAHLMYEGVDTPFVIGGNHDNRLE